MKAVLTNFGTTGDVQPFVALGVELARAGHRPTLAASPGFESLAREHGLDFVAVGPELTDEINALTLRALEEPDLHAAAGGATLLGEPLARNLPQAYEDLHVACRGADVLISGPQQPAARMLHETTGLPFVSVQLTYVDNPGTREYRQATQALIDPFRERLGLPPLPDPLTRGADSDQLALYAISRHVLPPPREWGESRHMTGFFFLDEAGFQPPAQLEAFLQEGEPPVVVTLGSNYHEDPRALTRTLLESVAATGRRLILQEGWSGLGSRALPENVLTVGYVPHAWLLPRAAAVLCHGGVGTSAAVFRAGVPGVFLPHVFDQFLWARLAKDLGVAPEPVDFRRLRAETLTAALERALGDPDLRRRASELGRAVRAEGGVVEARRRIEDLLRSLGLLQPTTSARKPQTRRWGHSTRKRNGAA